MNTHKYFSVEFYLFSSVFPDFRFDICLSFHFKCFLFLSMASIELFYSMTEHNLGHVFWMKWTFNGIANRSFVSVRKTTPLWFRNNISLDYTIRRINEMYKNSKWNQFKTMILFSLAWGNYQVTFWNDEKM